MPCPTHKCFYVPLSPCQSVSGPYLSSHSLAASPCLYRLAHLYPLVPCSKLALSGKDVVSLAAFCEYSICSALMILAINAYFVSELLLLLFLLFAIAHTFTIILTYFPLLARCAPFVTSPVFSIDKCFDFVRIDIRSSIRTFFSLE